MEVILKTDFNKNIYPEKRMIHHKYYKFMYGEILKIF